MSSNKTGLGKLTISYKVKPNISPMTQVFIYHDLQKSVYSSHIYDSQILKKPYCLAIVELIDKLYIYTIEQFCDKR